MSKSLKFFLGHLTISIIIALVMIVLVFFVWYPSPLAKAIGVTSIFLMLIAIDVIIGPLLTLLVYKEGKKTLKMDLTVIILVQITALIYGMYNIIDGRPVWIVQNGERFELVRNNDIILDNIKQAKLEYQELPWFKPQFVYIDYGKTEAEKNKNMLSDSFRGIVASYYLERYSNIKQAAKNIQDKMQYFDKLIQLNNEKEIQNKLQNYPQAAGWMPMLGIDVDMTVLLDQEGNIVKIETVKKTV